MDSAQRRISEILIKATENEDISKGFFEDLTYSNVDEHYIENLLKSKKEKRKQP